MRHFKLIVPVVALVGALAVAMAAATPASAICKAVWLLREGRWLSPSCTGAEGPYKNYRNVTPSAERSGIYECSEVESGQTGTYSNSMCSAEAGATKRWVWTLIMAPAKAQFLPAPTSEKPVKFTGTSGKGTFSTASGTSVHCESDKSTGSLSSETAGSFADTFEKCAGPLSGTCTGLTLASGTIGIEGTLHLDTAKVGEASVAVAAILPKEIHFTCTVSGIETLILVKGCVAGVLNPLDKAANTFQLVMSGKEGKQEITKVAPSETEEVECKLEDSLSGGKFEAISEESADELDGFTQGGKSIEGEIMT
jgi:hypothetical protein